MLRLLGPLLAILLESSCDAQGSKCESCIDRTNYRIKVIVHGTRDNDFWLQIQAASLQAGKDMTIDLQMDLYDTFSDARMVNDIISAVIGDNRPDALVVSIPSEEVAEAVKTAIDAGVPVFGLNSGYTMASDLGVLGFVAMDEYLGGTEAANAILATAPNNFTNALYINSEKKNSALDTRREGFADRLAEINAKTEVEELIVDGLDDPDMSSKINTQLKGCPYGAVLLSSSSRLLEHTISASKFHGCGRIMAIGTFDTSSEVCNAIALGDVAFGISQHEYLQGALPIVMASIFATTGKRLALPENYKEGVYLSGPKVFVNENIPSDTLQTCAADSFPICPNTQSPYGGESKCPCTDRSKITIGGVLHGVSTDSFWDEVFAASEQATRDMGVNLKLDRMEPDKESVLYAKMAGKIESLCKNGVDGIFVSIPSERVVEAIDLCLELNIPVISIDSGAEKSEALGLMHHIGRVEYNAGIRAGSRLFNHGMKKGYCLNHQPGNVALDERCNGFEKAIKLLARFGVEYGGTINVPADNAAQYRVVVEAAVGETGDWAGIGLMIGGQSQVPSATALNVDHPAVIMGSFDVSDEIYAALDEDTISFGMDQQAYLQGYYPVLLLTYMAYTKQHLQNRLVETGPSFVESAPSDAQRQCEEKFYEVCVPREPLSHSSSMSNTTALIITVSVVGGVLVLAMLFVIFRLYKLSKHIEELEKRGQPVPKMSLVRKLSSLHLDPDSVVDKARRESLGAQDATSAAEEAGKSAGDES